MNMMTLSESQKQALAFLTGPDGAEARDGLNAMEIADVIVNVAQYGAAARFATHHTQVGSLEDSEKADLIRLLGRPSTSHERILLVRTLRVLMGASE